MSQFFNTSCLRSLDSSQVGGREGVAIAVINYWFARYFDHSEVECVGMKVGVAGFHHLSDYEIGTILVPASNWFQQFDDWVKSNPDVAGIFAHSGQKQQFSFI